jgi:RecJ-like exonuclease
VNKRRRFKSKQRRYVGRLAQQVLACVECRGKGKIAIVDETRIDEGHVSVEFLLCAQCDGSGNEPTWQAAALLEWVLFGTYHSKTIYESHPLGARCAQDWI